MSLHLVNQIHPDIPVILTDTGYLFPETYRFIDELTDKLKLNLKVYRANRKRRLAGSTLRQTVGTGR
ncbi:phosphoadenosine phosphosulfate reductase [Escherichia coli]|uniref:Phosphoadenosine phosphosulfate reductase n=1 Tax=Escherichia coli TaxID=562 RepID=A0A376KMT6_ECOLX|nr:phosphoadenosine phosphosulfate reductase [Escherichia coli]